MLRCISPGLSVWTGHAAMRLGSPAAGVGGCFMRPGSPACRGRGCFMRSGSPAAVDGRFLGGSAHEERGAVELSVHGCERFAVRLPADAHCGRGAKGVRPRQRTETCVPGSASGAVQHQLALARTARVAADWELEAPRSPNSTDSGADVRSGDRACRHAPCLSSR